MHCRSQRHKEIYNTLRESRCQRRRWAWHGNVWIINIKMASFAYSGWNFFTVTIQYDSRV